MLKFVLLAACLVLVSADISDDVLPPNLPAAEVPENVTDIVIEAFKDALKTLDIPEDRMMKYAVSVVRPLAQDNRRRSIAFFDGPAANGLTPLKVLIKPGRYCMSPNSTIDHRSPQEALDGARTCIQPSVQVGTATLTRIMKYITDLAPVAMTCNDALKADMTNDVKKRQQTFKDCVEKQVKESMGTFDDKEKETLSKIEECIVTAIKGVDVGTSSK